MLRPIRKIAMLTIAVFTLFACSGNDGADDANDGTDDDSNDDTDDDSGPGSISIPEGQNAARMTVTMASSTLAAGDYEFESIGFAPQRNDDEFYANFAESDANDVLRTLNFYGLHRVGSFACGDRAKPGDDYAVKTNIDLKNYEGGGLEIYDASFTGSTCQVIVTRMDASVIEGQFSATLNTSDSSSSVTITGEFRSHRP